MRAGGSAPADRMLPGICNAWHGGRTDETTVGRLIDTAGSETISTKQTFARKVATGNWKPATLRVTCIFYPCSCKSLNQRHPCEALVVVLEWLSGKGLYRYEGAFSLEVFMPRRMSELKLRSSPSLAFKATDLWPN